MPQINHAISRYRAPVQADLGVAPLRRAIRRPLFGLLFTLSLCPIGQFAAAQPEEENDIRRAYDIPAGSLGAVLSRFAGDAGAVLSFDATLLAGLSSPGLKGEYGVEEGFAELLRGSGYAARRSGA